MRHILLLSVLEVVILCGCSNDETIKFTESEGATDASFEASADISDLEKDNDSALEPSFDASNDDACIDASDQVSEKSTIRITRPSIPYTELTFEDDGDPEQPGFQFDIEGLAENVGVDSTLELFLDNASFDDPIVTSPDENGIFRFYKVTLPAGSHGLKVGSRIASNFSNQVDYTLYVLDIDSIDRREDLEYEGLVYLVYVYTFGFEPSQEIVLIVEDEQGQTQEYSETLMLDRSGVARSVWFYPITLPFGEVNLKAQAQLDSDIIVTSTERTKDVTPCSSAFFIARDYPLHYSDYIILNPGNDTITDDGQCGDEFGIDVDITTGVLTNASVELSVKSGTITIYNSDVKEAQESIITFEDVRLSTDGPPNIIRAYIESEDYQPCIFSSTEIRVDCS